MVQDIYGWELSYNYEKVIVKQFSGSTTEDMMKYIKPPLKLTLIALSSMQEQTI